jgi:hypothetical protein
MVRVNEIRCPNNSCGIDPKTKQGHGQLLAMNVEVLGDLRGAGVFQFEIRCRRCKTVVKVVYTESRIVVRAA